MQMPTLGSPRNLYKATEIIYPPEGGPSFRQCFFFLRENKSNAWNRFFTFFWLFSRNETIFHAQFSRKFHGQYEIFTHSFHKLFTYWIFFFTGTFWKNFTYWILFSRTKTLRIFTQSSFIFTHILSYYHHYL